MKEDFCVDSDYTGPYTKQQALDLLEESKILNRRNKMEREVDKLRRMFPDAIVKFTKEK